VRLQPIYDIAEICAQQGITNTVLCPGSRCAPLTLAFARHPVITCYTFSDERSAAFIALGMAQQTQKPVSLVCTSGSAAYNFAPAIAEAFFQQIPLLIFTADRPAEWIDQWDGQTIRQHQLYGSHVKKSYQLPQDDPHRDAVWHSHRIISEAINVSKAFPAGPVHINVPLREPLYPAAGEVITFSKNIRIIKSTSSQAILTREQREELQKKLRQYSKIMVVAGQQDHDAQLAKRVDDFCARYQAVLMADIISNLHGLQDTIRHADVYLGQCPDVVKETLAPQLLITFGKSVISKNLKLFLRTYKPQEHWHLQPHAVAADTFQSLTQVITVSPGSFFESMAEGSKPGQPDTFRKAWQAEEKKTVRSMRKHFKASPFSEFKVIQELMDGLPAGCNLHLSNSMAVRYANFIGLKASQKKITVFANRGTSGIDGCTSTAAGHVLSGNKPTILLTGDMAFFYDRNAFWHNYPLPDFHVVVINNQGGVIFNLIDGPSALPEKDALFVTQQKLAARNLADEYGFEYFKMDSLKNISSILQKFFTFNGKTRILEIVSDQESAKKHFEIFKQTIKKNY
jgi:2-succinyl-5-enolpyruvyl-6-hydroxy-3-cyclohexene-1-carboxylate synthase